MLLQRKTQNEVVAIDATTTTTTTSIWSSQPEVKRDSNFAHALIFISPVYNWRKLSRRAAFVIVALVLGVVIAVVVGAGIQKEKPTDRTAILGDKFYWHTYKGHLSGRQAGKGEEEETVSQLDDAKSDDE